MQICPKIDLLYQTCGPCDGRVSATDADQTWHVFSYFRLFPMIKQGFSGSRTLIDVTIGSQKSMCWPCLNLLLIKRLQKECWQFLDPYQDSFSPRSQLLIACDTHHTFDLSTRGSAPPQIEGELPGNFFASSVCLNFQPRFYPSVIDGNISLVNLLVSSPSSQTLSINKILTSVTYNSSLSSNDHITRRQNSHSIRSTRKGLPMKE